MASLVKALPLKTTRKIVSLNANSHGQLYRPFMNSSAWHGKEHKVNKSEMPVVHSAHYRGFKLNTSTFYIQFIFNEAFNLCIVRHSHLVNSRIVSTITDNLTL